jgi:hypothetical protein
MNLTAFLKEKKQTIIQKWFDLIVKAYPKETALFLQQLNDQFDNPVGHAIKAGIEEIFDSLTLETQTTQTTPQLTHLIKIRAVQDFSASEGVGFIFLLKRLVRDEALSSLNKHQNVYAEILAFEDKIDQAALNAFELFMTSKETLYELRVDEFKRNTLKMTERLSKKFFT